MKFTSLKHLNIIQLLSIESLTKEKRIAIVEQSIDLIEARILVRVLEKLSESDKKLFSDLLTSEDSKQVLAFLSGQNIDVMNMMEEEVEKIKQELLVISEERDW